MLILLGTSTLAAALVPTPPPGEDTSSSSTSPRTSPVPAGGELVEVKLDVDAKRPPTVRAALGDQVSIVVRSSEAAQIQIERLGLLNDVLPLSPARFDILANRTGRFEVRLIEPDRRLGIIDVPRERGRKG